MNAVRNVAFGTDTNQVGEDAIARLLALASRQARESFTSVNRSAILTTKASNVIREEIQR